VQKENFMKYQAQNFGLEEIKAQAIVRFCYRGGHTDDAVVKKLDKMSDGLITRVFAAGEFEGKENQTVVVHTPKSIAADKVVLVGLGEKVKVDSDGYRRAAGTSARLDAIKAAREVAFVMDGHEGKGNIAAVVEGFALGGFEILDYKSEKKSESKTETVFVACGNKRKRKQFEKEVEDGNIIAEGAIQARRLSSDPSNYLTPEIFAAKARQFAKKFKFGCQVLDDRKIAKENMGALMAVAQGSDNPPRFVILKYDGGNKGTAPVVLVGKGITFDSGGISIKPGLNMHEMKQDMTGGAVVLTTLITAARLKVRQNIVGLIPLAENMPSGKAVKPGDIITSRKGKTIEIINTDAEGRLILADALDYANKFKPQAVIDIATLTGATKYILGYAGAPIIGNDDRLIDYLYDASGRTGEKVWHLPIWERHREQMKSDIADLKNSGGPFAGTIAAAAFLENFTGAWPWGHIDIAYMDHEVETQPYVPKGPTGFGMRLLVNMLGNWKKL